MDPSLNIARAYIVLLTGSSNPITKNEDTGQHDTSEKLTVPVIASLHDMVQTTTWCIKEGH